jgi:ubiquinone biosynthesis protein
MRFIKICLVASHHLLFYPITSLRSKTLGERLALAFEKLGISFIKIGQTLSLRYDILDEKDCIALQRLLDKANILPYETIRSIIESDYKMPINQVFKEFQRQPLGSASVSQVHKAVTFDGKVVAVKVKRPNVEQHLTSDIRIMKFFALLGMTCSRTLRKFQLYGVVVFFEAWIRQDIDFRLEAKNIKIFREQELSNSSEKYKVFCMDIVDELCTDNVVVMDFVEGIPVSKKKELFENKEYDIYKTIETYMNAIIKNWFRDDISEFFFQADPHLSNIIALPNGGVANIDCGLISRLSKKEMMLCRKITLAIYFKDVDKIIKVASDLADCDYETYRPRLIKDVERYLEQTDDEGLGFWFFGFTKIMVKHNMKYPPYLTTLGRGNVVVDGFIKTYIPEYTAHDLLKKQLKEHAAEYMRNAFNEDDMLRLGYSFVEKMKKTQNTNKIFDIVLDDFARFSKAVHGRLDS